MYTKFYNLCKLLNCPYISSFQKIERQVANYLRKIAQLGFPAIRYDQQDHVRSLKVKHKSKVCFLKIIER